MTAQLPSSKFKQGPVSLSDYSKVYDRVKNETPSIRLTDALFAPFKLASRTLVSIQLFAIPKWVMESDLVDAL
eukprot:1238316-Rhodomonas_salina.1